MNIRDFRLQFGVKFRHYATSRKVEDSIPNGVIGNFIDIILPAELRP